MKILTAAQMRTIDELTIAQGIPSLILMENAAHRVTEFLAARFAPLREQRIVVLCGKGNNGGDGLAIARQLQTRFSPRRLDVVLTGASEELSADAAANLRMLVAVGVTPSREISAEARLATLVVDALLGTGIRGGAHGKTAEWIEEINSGFSLAKVVAVDVPSGMASDSHDNEGVCARADYTVTFTAPKVCHATAPNCDRCGEITVAPIGTRDDLLEGDGALFLSLMTASWFGRLFQPRPRASNKGDFGHVLTIGGSVGRTGAAAMCGLASLRAGAGLATVATAQSALASVAAFAPEMMTEPLPETEAGTISSRAIPVVDGLSHRKSILAVGPGIGTHPDTVAFCQTLYAQTPLPLVVDADAITAISGSFLRPGGPRILTPHPGEMARLAGCSVPEVQADRVNLARSIATDRGITIVLKGQRTVIAFPDGRVWINPTGTPAMATGGTGDILTGLICGLMSQFQDDADYAIGAAVWLHGRAGEIGAAALGERSLIATDILKYLPEAMRELENVHS
jgi:NAD(P)H-hydrate epimerase